MGGLLFSFFARERPPLSDLPSTATRPPTIRPPSFRPLSYQWQWNLTNCDSSLLYDDYRMIDISDDGSTAAFSAFIPTGTTSAPLLTVFDGQSGAVRYSKSFAAGTGAGPVMVTENGAYVAWEAGTGLQIYNGKTGALRDTIPGAGNAEVSDSGDFVAAGGESSVTIYKWNATNNAYSVAFTL